MTEKEKKKKKQPMKNKLSKNNKWDTVMSPLAQVEAMHQKSWS